MIYTKLHWATNLILWIQVLLVTLSQVYKIKHLDVQSAFINICEGMGCSDALAEFVKL